MKNDKINLEELLRAKTEIQPPHGLEEKIMRRIYAERAKPKANVFSLFAPRNYYAMAASFAAVLIAVSVLLQAPSTHVQKISSVDESEIEKLSEEVQFYETATNIISEADPEDALDQDMQEIQQMDELINLLSS